jgi:hypothetical protein
VDGTAVNRVRFISALCQGKRVLCVGYLGTLQVVIDGAARKIRGIGCDDDKTKSPLVFQACDFEQLEASSFLPFHREEFDYAVIGETLGQASNPGRVLDVFRKSLWGKLVVVMPTGFGRSRETMVALLGHHKYVVAQWHYYDEEPPHSDGTLIVCVR